MRTKEITELEAQTTLDLFESDYGKYTFIATDSIVIEQARILISKYGMQGLRTLGSLQYLLLYYYQNKRIYFLLLTSF